MKKVLYISLIALVGFTFSANAGMKLKLRSDLSNENTATLGNHNIESNMQLKLPVELAPSGKMELIKGLFLIGLAFDVAFPLGELGDSWSTGFSAHAMLAYMITRSILLDLSVGYIRFGEKESIEGFDQSYSWIPILLGLNYIFNSGQNFRPFIGLALGYYLIRLSFTFNSDEQSFNNEEFGIAPRIGAYFLVSAAILLALTVQYNYLFSEGESSTAALGILFSIMFALGH